MLRFIDLINCELFVIDFYLHKSEQFLCSVIHRFREQFTLHVGISIFMHDCPIYCICARLSHVTQVFSDTRRTVLDSSIEFLFIPAIWEYHSEFSWGRHVDVLYVCCRYIVGSEGSQPSTLFPSILRCGDCIIPVPSLPLQDLCPGKHVSTQPDRFVWGGRLLSSS